MALEVSESLDAYLAFQLAEVHGSLPLIAAADQEAVHSARLALRRLRSGVSCFSVFLPPVPVEARRGIKWLATSLGEARDLFVLAQRVRLWLDAPVAWRSADVLHTAVDGLAEKSNTIARLVAGDPRAHLALEGVAAAFSSDHTRLGGPTPEQAIGRLDLQWEVMQRRLARASGIPSGRSRNDFLHDARKDVKKLRYAVEAVAGALGPGSNLLLQPAVALQRVLGEHHDAVAGMDWTSALSTEPGVEASDVNELRRMEGRRLEEAERGFRQCLLETTVPRPSGVLQPAGTLLAGPAPGQS
jgi:CHAD domain-containing protein